MVYRLLMCARTGAASLPRLGGIEVLAYVYRLLYRWVIVVPPSYVRSHRCGLARYARSAGGIRVLAYVHRLLYRWVIVVPPIRA